MQLNFYAPIVLFCFNRPEHLQRALDALSSNEGASESHITFFCDGPRNEEEKIITDAVRKIAHAATGFASVTVIEREKNMGCADSVIDGLKYMFERNEKLIIIEDDILCSPYTLSFLNEGLQRYKDNDKVFSIATWSPQGLKNMVTSNYEHNVCAIPLFNCWGWASWRNRFENIDWNVGDYHEFKNSVKLQNSFAACGRCFVEMLDAQMQGKIDSWAIRAEYARFKKNQISIDPVISYTTNIGMGSGTHCSGYTDKFDNDISKSLPVANLCWLKDVQIHSHIVQELKKFYDAEPQLSWKGHLCKFVKKLISKLKNKAISFVKKNS